MINLLPKNKNNQPMPLLYENIIDEKYHLMYLNASTKSGKTYSLTQLLLNYYLIPHSNQKIFIICPTLQMCKTWKSFINLVGNFNQIILFENIDDNTLKIIEKLRNKDPVSKFVDACENIIIIDDMSEHTRGNLITGLTKKYRHWKSSLFICSQSYIDLNPSAKGQLDCIALWGGIQDKYLKRINEDLLGPFHMDLNTFIQAYRYETSEPHTFIFINLKKRKIRRGWIDRGSLIL